MCRHYYRKKCNCYDTSIPCPRDKEGWIDCPFSETEKEFTALYQKT